MAQAAAAPGTISLEQYEAFQPVLDIPHEDQRVTYCTPNRMTVFRVQSFYTKEPETVEWIASFAPDDVLVDIGANVGMYTVWAARTAGAKVFAFEPESQNYALLNKNIAINKLAGQVVAFCAALSDECRFDRLFLSRFETGQSMHVFGAPLNHELQPCDFPLTQGAVSVTLDSLVADGTIPVPQHIKIDVDGFEYKVLRGARTTLENPAVKSLLVEINQKLPEHAEAVQALKDLGFSYSLDQVAASERLDGPFKGVANYVFRR